MKTEKHNGQKDSRNRLVLDQSSLTALFDDQQGEIYRCVIELAMDAGLPFALGGGFAINAYTGLSRNTKDLDLYVLPRDRTAMIDVLNRAGLRDYYDQAPYDRGWIYRGFDNGTIVDVIWEMANHRSQVDRHWLTRGPLVEVEGMQLRLLPPEELLWGKLYVLQRDRCDWPDILNLLYATGEDLDWQRLLDRVGRDDGLLAGVVTVFAWLCPGRAGNIPAWLWQRLRLPEPVINSSVEVNRDHVVLIDSRPWFSPVLNPEPFQPAAAGTR
ncbi:MAG: nucleotidyltransferase [Blastocatellia bacterium]